MEGDGHIVLVDGFGKLFLSTPSGWRATRELCDKTALVVISIHALRVEGDGKGQVNTADGEVFLSTPSGWRATFGGLFNSLISMVFLSTPSGWRATFIISYILQKSRQISIHALRVEGDRAYHRVRQLGQNFYPRPPGGGRLCLSFQIVFVIIFLSTPSGWRATIIPFPCRATGVFLSTPSGWRATQCHVHVECIILEISIHALRVEGDSRNSHGQRG